MVSKRTRLMNGEYKSAGLTAIAERGWLPDFIIRRGIRRLLTARLRSEMGEDCEERHESQQRFLESMGRSPVAIVPQKANEQHYEIPAKFFELVLGRHRKYSCCYWPEDVRSLDEAEAAMLALTCDRAELADGQSILELGCGWGSLTLWMATHYPNAAITAISNSASQGAFIGAECKRLGLNNVEIITADMNTFVPTGQFDRVVSVEMFEHMRNLSTLLHRINGWLAEGGKLFVHIFTHQLCSYPFETTGKDDWMGRYFFSGGMMPSDHLLLYLQDVLKLDRHWCVSGRHYQKTANAWLANMTSRRDEIMPILRETYGKADAECWFNRWRIFFMACAELWGFHEGNEWRVGHYLMSRRTVNAVNPSINESSGLGERGLQCTFA